MTTLEDFLRKAIEEERQASDEYYDKALEVEDPVISKKLRRIADQEHDHYVTLKWLLRRYERLHKPRRM